MNTTTTIHAEAREDGNVIIRFGTGMNDWFAVGPEERIGDILCEVADQIAEKEAE